MDLEHLVLEARQLVIEYISQRPDTSQRAIDLWAQQLEYRCSYLSGGLKIPGRGFSIGDVAIGNPVVSAPLAGISDNTYRIFAAFFGCGLTYSEMITSYGLHYNHKKSIALAGITDMERPCAVQIFGSEPEIMAEAAIKLESIADIIDINMGCPVAKILKAKSGGWLLKEPGKAADIIKAVTSAVKIPVTVKTRLGWNSSSINVIEFAKRCQDSGASAIAIHGRTVKQGFRGQADYLHIRKVKQELGIPVIASGDINDANKAGEVLQYTDCDAIMIGRSSKGNMWVFADIILDLLGHGPGPNPDTEWLKRFAVCYLKFMVFFKGEQKAVKEFRKYLSWIFKGMRGISAVKKDFFTINSIDEATKVIDSLDNGM